MALFILLPMFPCSNLIPWCKVLSPVQPLTPIFIFFSSWPLTLPDILLLFGYLRSLLLERGLQEKRLVPIRHYSISGAWKLTSKPGNLSNSLVKKNAYVSDSRSVVSDSCDLMHHSPPGSSVHGIFQERILEWVAISFSRGSSRPRVQTCNTKLLTIVTMLDITSLWLIYFITWIFYLLVSFTPFTHSSNPILN